MKQSNHPSQPSPTSTPLSPTLPPTPQLTQPVEPSLRDHFRFHRFWAIVKKEQMHVLRDPFVLMLAMLLPFLVVIILGSSIEFNLKNIATAVVDQDDSLDARRLVESFGSSDYFKTYYITHPEQLFNEVTTERAKVGIFIPPNFSKNLRSEAGATIQILVDGADNSSISAALGYLSSMRTKVIQRILDHQTSSSTSTSSSVSSATSTSAPGVNIVERYLFNDELNSKWFAIPGLSAVIIALVAILLTTLTICKEWEHGSMELLMSTPVHSAELMLGKIVPYALLSAVGFSVVYLVARLLFGVPVRGSHLTLAIFTIIFIIDYLGIGLYISVTTKEQQIAIQKALTIGLLPTSMLSGFIFPIKYMPLFLQHVASLFPARWYVDAVRGVFLHGNTLLELKIPLLILMVQGVIILSAAVLNFRRSLE